MCVLIKSETAVYSNYAAYGELCLLTKQTRSVTAIVLESSDLIRHSNEDMTEYPMLGLKLLRHIFLVISKRLSRSTERMAAIF
ncbi:MAG: hypothetical protein ABFR82_09995 [Nitrospirota bacterium]